MSSSISSKVNDLIKNNHIMMFSKTTCPFCAKAKAIFDKHSANYFSYELDKNDDEATIKQILNDLTKQSTVPNIFINKKHIGGFSDLDKLDSSGGLLPLLTSPIEKPLAPAHNYDFDLIVVGGGSGGLAASKEAAKLGAKVLVLDYVVPTPKGTTWGLGGTCVNVGCIPKKLMHQSGLLGHSLTDARAYGWQFSEKVHHDWSKMVTEIQNHISSLNWGYRVALRDNKVEYRNVYGTFIDAHTMELRDRSGGKSTVTGQHFIVATGERPRYLGLENEREACITSDDLFSLDRSPGKTLVVGASYVALECAGFLTSLGLPTTVMARSILLRGFDQQMAELIGEYMQAAGTRFLRPCVPIKIECRSKEPEPLYEVTGRMENGELHTDTYNTIILAVGRNPCTRKLGLETVGVQLDQAGRVLVDRGERTSVPHIYAIGDIISTGLQLTPVAIRAGLLLARRLFTSPSTSTNNTPPELCDYESVPTTVFTPLEYGCVGLSEERAREVYGDERVDVYHTNFQPLEWTVAHREANACYAKVVVDRQAGDRVLGLHVLAPNAGEIVQGFAVALKLGATKADLDRTIGIHPTCAEVFTTLRVTKSSGLDAKAAGC